MTSLTEIFNSDEQRVDRFLSSDESIRLPGKKITATILAFRRFLLSEHDNKLFEDCKVLEVFENFYVSSLSGKVIKNVHVGDDEISKLKEDFFQSEKNLNQQLDNVIALSNRLKTSEEKHFELSKELQILTERYSELSRENEEMSEKYSRLLGENQQLKEEYINHKIKQLDFMKRFEISIEENEQKIRESYEFPLREQKKFLSNVREENESLKRQLAEQKLINQNHMSPIIAHAISIAHPIHDTSHPIHDTSHPIHDTSHPIHDTSHTNEKPVHIKALITTLERMRKEGSVDYKGEFDQYHYIPYDELVKKINNEKNLADKQQLISNILAINPLAIQFYTEKVFELSNEEERMKNELKKLKEELERAISKNKVSEIEFIELQIDIKNLLFKDCKNKFRYYESKINESNADSQKWEVEMPKLLVKYAPKKRTFF